MTKATLHHTPLNSSSQNTTEPVLYYNSNASLDSIYECATAKINAVINLLENLFELKAEQNAVSAVASITTILLNDAKILLEELDPIALQLRQGTHP